MDENRRLEAAAADSIESLQAQKDGVIKVKNHRIFSFLKKEPYLQIKTA